MKTTAKNTATTGKVNNDAVTEKTAIRPSLSSKESAIVPNKDFDNVETPQNPLMVIVEEQPKKQDDQVAYNTEVPKETSKVEIKEDMQENKPARNLDSTVELVLILNRRIGQRGKLIETIDNLKAFEIIQQDDAEETGTNHFQGCELTIRDDEGRKFTTKNSFIIRAVATTVYDLCTEKLGEIESEIFIPA
ncbi:hypothetical protein AQ505_12920 [Pedobacter sp. PACM 27299]|uniref:hypothetical protein n=1 Tax=Pedobacter sp. PACM 27299 TaxID=1727164 RepID=UPI000705CD79|nr:hypothetical protein [Pedobacter sp. PACM 27299]ALL06321.1 hypothetical protein AQ505_12920 [Pedobacter sp. PACM 27299]